MTQDEFEEPEEAVVAEVPAAVEPAVPKPQVRVPAPVAITEPATMVLNAAATLAAAIDRCARLNARIAGLEASLAAAVKEQNEADAAKDAAQDVLRELIEVKS